MATWEASDAKSTSWLTLFPMEINLKTPPREWKPDVEATLNLRRYADGEQRGSQIKLSEIEFFDHPKFPGGFYTMLDESAGEGVITMTRLSPKLECVVFWVGARSTHEAMAERARKLVPAIDFAPQ